MNQKTLLLALFCLMAVLSAGGMILYSMQGANPVIEKVRDETMQSIKTKHPETAQFMKDLAWSGGRVTPPGLIGAETYEYKADGWTITIKYPVIPNPEYSITADYSASRLPGYIGIPYSIVWKGTYQNGIITETSYVFAQ
jgi:hypothetical protein